MEKLIVLLSLLLSFSVFAENFRVGKVPNTLKVEHKRVDHIDYIRVYDNKSEIFEFEATLVTQKILQFGLVQFKGFKKPHLVTVWSSGAHGQELIIFDLAKYKDGQAEKSIAYLYGSAWTIDLDINQERIEIKGKGEVDEKTDKPVDQSLTFRP